LRVTPSHHHTIASRALLSGRLADSHATKYLPLCDDCQPQRPSFGSSVDYQE
jgi:hypothetical protein